MNCENCGVKISDWQIIKNLSKGKMKCSECDVEYKLRERGIGLAQTASLLGVVVASIFSLSMIIIEIPLWMELPIWIGVIYSAIKLSLRCGVEITKN